MRLVTFIVLLATVTPARADQKIQGMKPGFVKEAAACQIEARGVTRIVSGGTELAKSLTGTEKDEIEKDLVKLSEANTTITAYCAEVEGLVKFLEDNAKTAYKAVEKEIDERDNKVRRLRKDTKRLVLEVTPITRKLIPRIKRTPAPASAEEKLIESAFPSGRKVVLPKLAGTWKLSGSATTDTAEYAEKTATASVTTRPFDKMSCEQQRTAFAAKAEAVADLEPPLAAKAIDVEWSARLTTRDKVPHLLAAMCVHRGMGGVMVTADVQPAKNKVLAEQLAKLMVAMLAAQLDVKPAKT